MSCRSGCLTQDHAGWGACARAARLQIDRHAFAGHRPAEKDKDARLTRYESARRSGLQPAGTQWRQIRDAEENGGVEKTPVTKPGGD